MTRGGGPVGGACRSGHRDVTHRLTVWIDPPGETAGTGRQTQGAAARAGWFVSGHRAVAEPAPRAVSAYT